MIHSTVSSGEADAIQRQVDQLFGILQQMLHDTMLWLASRNQQRQSQEGVLRIWMGNGKDGRILRQVYGPMANGKHRNDLTPERLKAILNALQEPVTEGINLAQYAKRKPAIEIKIDDVTLFRQERDGVVTVNQIQLQQQVQNGQSAEQQLSQSPQVALSDAPKAEQELQDEQIQRLAQIARHLMNPLGKSGQPFLTRAGFGDFTLEYDPEQDSLVVSRGRKPILRDDAGKIENLGVTSADWKIFQPLGDRMAQSPVLTASPRELGTIIEDRPIKQTPKSASLDSTYKAADRQINRLQPQLQRFLQRIVQGTATWLNQALLKWQHGTVAYLAMKAFQQGYDRTGEEAYQVGNFSISRESRNQFTLREQTGVVMRFAGKLGSIKLTEISDRLTQTAINDAVIQLSSIAPQGQHEANYAFRVREAEQTVRDFLTYMKTPVWDYEQGKFRLEMIDNQVLITSKQDGRGQIHGPEKVMQKNHREKLVSQPTRLTWKDLDHLDSIRDKLRVRIAADQEKQKKTQTASVQPLSLSEKSRQASQRSRWKPKGRELE